MKRTILKAWMAVGAFACSLGLHAANSLTVSPIEGDAATDVEVSVSLFNTDPIGALQVLMTLPEETDLTVYPEAVPSGAAAEFSASAGLRDGKISVMLYSLSGKTIAAGESEVVRFRVNLGNKPVDTKMEVEARVSDPAGNRLTCEASPVSFVCRRPVLEIGNRSVDFGRVPLNSTQQRSLTLRNTGTAPLEVSSIICDRSEFEVTSSLPMTIAPGSSASMSLRFNPNERGEILVPAQVISNSTGTFNVVELSATPYAVNTITVGTASGTSDSEVEIPLTVANMDPVNGLTLELPLPKEIVYVDGSFALDDSRATDHKFTANYNDGKLKVMIYSLTNSPFTGSDGTVASFKARIQGKGSVTLKPAKAVLSAFYKGEVTDVLSDTYNGRVTITYPTISVASALSLGRTSVTEQATATLQLRNSGNAPLTVSGIGSDTDHFEIITPMPLTVEKGKYVNVTVSCPSMEAGEFADILSIYSNDPDRRLVTVKVNATRYYDNHLEFSAPIAVVDQPQAWIEASLSNYCPVKGLQFDVTFPEQILTASDDIETVDRAKDFQVIKRDIAPGVARYFIFSLSGSVIEPGEGEILRIPFSLPKAFSPARSNSRLIISP